MILHRRIVVEYKVLPIGTETIDWGAIGIFQVVRVGIDRSLTAVYGTLILQDCIIGSAGYIALLPCTLPAVREVIVNLCLAHLTLLGSNEDNTIGSTGTINGSRSILQYRDTLYLRGIQVVESLSTEVLVSVTDLYIVRIDITIDNEERLLGCRTNFAQ